MKKEINEKTFELNITNELLTLSKSFIWYLNYSPFCHLLPTNTWRQFLNQSVLFSEGLTQEEENDVLTGGYDVSINFSHSNGQEGRLIFLQYKSGVKKNYSSKLKSNFYKPNAILKKRSPEHISFIFNDAADGTQHSTLRSLAKRIEIQSESVLYVFPRMTTKAELIGKIGNLIYNTSFVPILDLDQQAYNQKPQIIINDGVTHHYRTSYDGLTSEVNFFFFFYFYNNNIISELISELVCIYIERVLKLLIQESVPLIEIFIDALERNVEPFFENELPLIPYKEIAIFKIKEYLQRVKEALISKNELPKAPDRFTTIIPKEGLKIRFANKKEHLSIQHQIF